MEVTQPSSMTTAPASVLPLPIHTTKSPSHSSTTVADNTDKSSWRVVGSPPRKSFLSPPEDYTNTKDNNINSNSGSTDFSKGKENQSHDHRNYNSNNRNEPVQEGEPYLDFNNEHQPVRHLLPYQVHGHLETSPGAENIHQDGSMSQHRLGNGYQRDDHNDDHQHQLSTPCEIPTISNKNESLSPSISTIMLESGANHSSTDSPASTSVQKLQLTTPTTPSPSTSFQTTSSSAHIIPTDHSYGPLEIITSDGADLQVYPNMGSGLVRNTGNGLDSPLSLSSFIWNGIVTEDAPALQSSPAHPESLGGMTTSRHQNSDPQNSLFSFSSALHAEPFVPARDQSESSRTFPMQAKSLTQPLSQPNYRSERSLSFSEPRGISREISGGYSLEAGANASSFRMPLPTMHEDEETFEPRAVRTRSHSTSATFGSRALYGGLLDSAFEHAVATDPFIRSTMSFSTSLDSASSSLDRYQSPNNNTTPGSSWPARTEVDQGYGAMSRQHQRSFTSSNHITPIWETPGAYLQHLQGNNQSEQDLLERQRVLRRYSLAPSSGQQSYNHFLENEHLGMLGVGNNDSSLHESNRFIPDNDHAQIQRRHSVAVPTGSYARHVSSAFNTLESSLESMNLKEESDLSAWSARGEPTDSDEYHPNTSDLGKGLTLSQLSHHGSLYAVEFKAGRKDLFYAADNSGLSLKRGDLVIVEADRGKDLGKITNDSITPMQVQTLAREYAEAASAAAASSSASGSQENSQRAPKEIHPKRIFRAAHTSEIAQLVNKSYDENKALIACQSKVRQKKLQMEVVDAEYQWDRRKLTFYFISDSRIDFRELVRDLFKMYKTRIWMCAVNGAGQRDHVQSESSSPSHSMLSSPVTTYPPSSRFGRPTGHQQHPFAPPAHHEHHGMSQYHQRAYSDQSYLHHQVTLQDHWTSQPHSAAPMPPFYPYQQHGRLPADGAYMQDEMFLALEDHRPPAFEEEYPRPGYYA